jgi:hypothetical protein
LLRAIEALAAYATAYRYPTSAGRIPSAPTQAAVSEWIEKVQAGMDEAVQRFGVDLDVLDRPASNPGPIR